MSVYGLTATLIIKKGPYDHPPLIRNATAYENVMLVM